MSPKRNVFRKSTMDGELYYFKAHINHLQRAEICIYRAGETRGGQKSLV